MFDVNKLVRPNVQQLVPYSSARDEFSGTAEVWLDANENCLDTGFNRYPDPYQRELKAALAALKSVDPTQLLLGNGSDEVIDLLYRAFCQPGKDKVIVMPPTYGMYQVCAGINDVDVIKVPLNEQFQPNLDALQRHMQQPDVKLLFCCSPNNPTGNVMDVAVIKQLAAGFNGLVVVDEAYIDLCPHQSVLPLLGQIPNLVVLQTFSKAWGLAGLRLGMAYASSAIISILNKIKPPYNINAYTQQQGLRLLQQEQQQVAHYRALITEQRTWLTEQLQQLAMVRRVYPSEANFVLAVFDQPDVVYNHLAGHGVVVRNRNSQVAGSLRITIGTPAENQQLMHLLKEMKR